MSLQLHKNRTEHWTIIKGRAKITLGKKEYLLKKGESIFIPKKKKHRVENISKKVLEIIEVQNGNYLGEDDIIRFEDDFGRAIEK